MRLSVSDSQRCVGCQTCMFACSRRKGDAGLANSCIGIKSAGGMSKGFIVTICQACINPPCARVCPTDAITMKKGRGIKFDPTKCISCENCKKACIVDAVFWNQPENKPMICIHCGQCVKFCPHKVLEMLKD